MKLFSALVFTLVAGTASAQDDMIQGPANDSGIEYAKPPNTNNKSPPVKSSITRTPFSQGPGYRVRPYFSIDNKPTLEKKLKNGTHVYKTKPSPQKHAAYFHAGPANFAGLVNNVTGMSYNQIYGNPNPILVNIDGEWQFFQKVGKLALKGGLGISTATGFGRFQFQTVVRPNPISEQPFIFVTIPVNAGLIYHAQFWDHQPLVPFVEVGGDYFGMFEYRNDKAELTQALISAGGAAWHFAAGGQFQLDFLDKEGIWSLDSEYGINHIYLTGDLRQFIGVSSTFNFTQTIIEGGILVEF